MRVLKGGTSRQRFFSQNWNLQLHPQELDTVGEHAELTSKIQSLEMKNKGMEKRILSLSNKLKEVSSRETTKQY